MRPTPTTADPPLTRLAWAGVVVLVLLGLFAVIVRFMYPADAALRMEPFRAAILETLGWTDPVAAVRPQALADFDRPYGAHPLTIRLHVIAGGMFLLLIPLQLSRAARSRFPAVHRAAGRTALAAGALMVSTALYFGVLMPFAGIGEGITMVGVSIWYVAATVRAVVAIRARDLALHREWMLRAIAIPLGVIVVRLAGILLDLLAVTADPRLWFQLSIWTGLTASIIAAELWIRRTRLRRVIIHELARAA